MSTAGRTSPESHSAGNDDHACDSWQSPWSFEQPLRNRPASEEPPIQKVNDNAAPHVPTASEFVSARVQAKHIDATKPDHNPVPVDVPTATSGLARGSVTSPEQETESAYSPLYLEGEPSPFSVLLSRAKEVPAAQPERSEVESEEVDYTSDSTPKTSTSIAAIKRKKQQSRRPGAPWFGMIFLCTVLLGFTCLVWFYTKDEPWQTDEDLRIGVRIDDSASTTAPQRLRSFLDSVVPLSNNQLGKHPAWQWDTPSLAEFVRANGVTFDNLRDLLEDGDWHPRNPSWEAKDLGTHKAWAEVAILLQAQAAYLMRRGEEEGAITAAMDLIELSSRLQSIWTWPSYQFRSQELHRTATQTMAELLKDSTLSSERLLAFQKEFEQLQPSDEVLQGAMNAFYVQEKKLLLGPDIREPLRETTPVGIVYERPGRLFFKINETLNLFGTAFRDLKKEIVTPPYAAFSLTGERMRRKRQAMPQFYLPNAEGQKYFDGRIQAYLDLPEAHSLARAHHGLVMTLFSIRRHVANHQQIPMQLDELVPNYLRLIPADPFSGEPFHYDPRKALLSSVGTNLIAEGGKPTQPPMGDDREPTVRVDRKSR